MAETIELIQRIPVRDRQSWLNDRKLAVTASEIGALFNCHSKLSKLALYLEKIGSPVQRKPIDPKLARRGRILEGATKDAVREERPDWRIKKATDFLFKPTQQILMRGAPLTVGIGATPDYIVDCPRKGRGILQTKTAIPAVFESQWTPEVPPLWIVLQAHQEMMLEQVEWGAIAVLVLDPWNYPLHIYEFEKRPDVHGELIEAVKGFWSAVEKGEQPDADAERDEDLVKTMYPRDNGEIINLCHDNRLMELISRHVALKEKIKTAAELDKTLKQIETEIRAKIGDNLGAFTKEWEVTLPLTMRRAYEVKETSYRTVRIKPRVLS